ncbi:class I SAM-dependent methyltransferase [Cellulomonas citrea]|uniref:class I SAM-dependent methyltransferase n=1 Tax=Cellulomonas citrea TaxID=1909423 RepID=UPI00135CC7AB|nr:methyltransferase [Cellulomonas citrea]
MGEHYFSAEPVSDARRRTLQVELAGRTVRVQTAGGVFSPDHVDLGTRVLLTHTPPPPADGELLDLGCGWGPVALELALRSEGRVWAVDVNARALDLVADNARALDLTTVHPALPDDVPADLTFDAIWSNPPIRIGKAALHELLGRWLPRLAPGGAAHLVVSKNLGADSLQQWIAAELGLPVERVASAKGFRVLRVDAAS